MKWLKYSVLAFIVLFSFSDDAWARRHHSHSRGRIGVGIALGVPAFAYHRSHSFHRPYRSSVGFHYGSYYGGAYPYYGSYPYYAPTYVAPVVVERPVYIEMATAEPDATVSAQASAQAASETYWYYCAASKGYYPYVGKCPSGWRKVPARPADAR